MRNLQQVVSVRTDSYFDFYLDGKLKGGHEKPTGDKPIARKSKIQNLFKLRDSNQDGKLTLEEFIGNPKGRNIIALKKRFKSMDKNKDQLVSRAEMEPEEKWNDLKKESAIS